METLLFLTSCIFLASAGYFHNKIDTVFNKTTKGILFSAAVIYSFMGFLVTTNPDIVIRSWRYVDWFITVPLLIYELYLFIEPKFRKEKELVLMIGFSILMLVFGLVGELGYLNKWLTNIIGSVFGFGSFYLLFKRMPKQHFKFLRAISILWVFYPITYLIEDSVWTIIAFAVVDLSVKVGSAFYIESREKFIGR
jgi:bacteriorhodopsin